MASLTRGLTNLQRQLDAAFPNRVRPDGWIGDPAHRARTSGHNPDDTPGSKPAWDGDPDTTPEVRALDVAANLGDGVTGQQLVDHLIALPALRAVVRYLIHRGHIWHTRTGFQREVHDGDPHTEHVHVEGAWTQAGDNNETFNFDLGAIPVALTAADKQWISAEISKAVAAGLDLKINDKANPRRTVGDRHRDDAKLRGVLVGDVADTANAALPPASPLARMIAAADLIIGTAASAAAEVPDES